MSNEFSRFFRSLERDKQYTLKRNAIVKKEFDRIKKQMIDEFDAHPITQEIEMGINAPNLSNTLNGITNLYSFIGFDSGSKPIDPIRQLLEKSTFRISSGGKLLATATFEIPLSTTVCAKISPPLASDGAVLKK